MNIKQQLVSSSLARAVSFGTGNPKKFITVHQTGNPSRGANAQAHANLQSRGFSASWHWQVDDKEAIQSFDHTWRLWHAGDGRGKGNMESIGIESCINSDGDYVKAVRNTAKLVAKIMKDEGIPISRVVQHNYWSGKNCPMQIRAGQAGITWTKFISMIQTELNQKPVEVKPQKPVTTGKEGNYYRVQLGAFREKANAENMLSKAKQAGFSDAFIVRYADGLYRVQVGAYAILDNAKKQEAKAKGLGFATYITNWQGSNPEPTSQKPKPVEVISKLKPIDEVAREVMNGAWGNGAERKSRLEKAGYNYTTVQNKVNALLGFSGGSTKRTGKWRFDTPVKIRSGPSTSHEQVGLYKAGDTVNLDGVETGNGYIWGTYIAYSGARRYVALQPVNGTPYGKWV